MKIEIIPLEYEYCEDVELVAKSCLPEHWSLDSIRDVLKYENNIYYVAKDVEYNKVVGYAGIMIIADESELLNIAVVEAYRKCGIAQRLLDLLFEQAKKHGAYRILLEVRRSNISAIQLYQKNSFSDLGVRKNYYSNPKEDALLMEKRF